MKLSEQRAAFRETMNETLAQYETSIRQMFDANRDVEDQFRLHTKLLTMVALARTMDIITPAEADRAPNDIQTARQRAYASVASALQERC